MRAFIAMMIIVALMGCAKEKDPCEGVTCENGGICADGSCNCIGLWMGPNCSQQITPLLLSTFGVQITKLPSTDAGGAGWDLTSGPDVYVVVKQNGNVLLSTSDNWAQNATPGITWNEGFSTNFPLNPITVELWDYDDFDSDDYMGAIQGTIYSSSNKFPEFVTMDCSGCNIAVKLGPISYL